MVAILWLVLAGIVLYTVGMAALKDRGLLPDWLRLSGPITTIHTGRGRALLERLAAPRRIWRAWGNAGIGVALVVMVGMALLVASAGWGILTRPEATPAYDPQHMLVIPGVNEFLPLSAAHYIIFGLLVGLVVHEGGHGLLCRVEDIEIDSLGLALFTVIPIGAFVEPDEASQAAADRGARTRMFAAGVTNNFAVTLLAIVLLFGPVMAAVGPAAGAGVGDVLAGSSADEAGLSFGDVIVKVNGTDVANASALDARLDAVNSSTVAIELRQGGPPIPVDRRLVIMGGSPAVLRDIDTGGDMLPRIQAVNGTAVRTEDDFATAVADRTIIELTTSAGTTTFPVGA
ncbi:MAG: site-2 protease family protein, partial [Salinirussus sp.]